MTQQPTIITPFKPKAISSHITRKQASYSHPISTIIFSPSKTPINPVFDIRAENMKIGQILKEKELLLYEQRLQVQSLQKELNELKGLKSPVLSQLEYKIEGLLCENQRLNQVLIDKERDNVNNPYISQLLIENQRLNDLIQQKELIYNEKELLYKEKESICLEKALENSFFNELIIKSEALIVENDRLNLFNRELQRDFEVYKEKYLFLEQSLDNYLPPKEENLKEKADYKMKENMKALIEENEKLNRVFNEKILNNGLLEGKLEIMIIENEKLNNIIEEKNKELENASNVEEFLKVNTRLNKALNEKKQEAEYWRNKFNEKNY